MQETSLGFPEVRENASGSLVDGIKRRFSKGDRSICRCLRAGKNVGWIWWDTGNTCQISKNGGNNLGFSRGTRNTLGFSKSLGNNLGIY